MWFGDLLFGVVQVVGEREEDLSQGVMRVADVVCGRCGATFGWKFCKVSSLSGAGRMSAR